MFIQTEITPNPNSLKFLPSMTVSNQGSFEVTKKEETNNELVRNILSYKQDFFYNQTYVIFRKHTSHKI